MVLCPLSLVTKQQVLGIRLKRRRSCSDSDGGIQGADAARAFSRNVTVVGARIDHYEELTLLQTKVWYVPTADYLLIKD
jgi:hypothetical protein